MSPHRPSRPTGRRSRRLLPVVVLGALALVVASVPVAAHRAEAAPPAANAWGRALSGSTAVASSLATSPAAASSTGTAASDSGSVQAGVGGGGTGVAVARARASQAGSTSACAAVLGSGGTLQLDADGTCTTSAGSSFVLPLSSTASLRAQAVVATCSVVAPGGAAASAVVLTGASIAITGALGVVTTVPLTSALRGTVQLPGGLGTVEVEDRSSVNGTPARAGTATATALHVRIGGAADVVVASVDCGTPAHLLPALPGGCAPVAAGLVAGAAWCSRRWWWASARGLLLPPAAGSAHR